jgi:PAS domain-containing protein
MTSQDCSSSRPSWEESERLAVLARYGILDSAPEPQFDDLVQLASQICETPISLISLVEENRQWFKAKVGLTVNETPIDVSLCAHGILQSDLFIIPDTHLDERFRNNPLVTGNLNLRFYAGAPIVTPDGLPMGMMCVIDDKPRQLTDSQKNALKLMAQQVMRFMDLRQAFINQTEMVDYLRASDERQQMALACGGIGTWEWDIVNNRVYADSNYARMMNFSDEMAGGGHPVEIFVEHIFDSDRVRVKEILRKVLANHEPYAAEYRIVNPDGSHRWICSRGRCLYNTDNTPMRLIGCSYDMERHRMTTSSQFLFNASKSHSS